MNWKLLSISLVAGAALAAGLASPDAARAAGDMSGSLGSGGVCKGDISMEAGETDRITVDLVQGATLSLAFSTGFATKLGFFGPDGETIDLGYTGERKVKFPAQTVQKSGTYRFEISSTDGSQGFYTLTAKQTWPKSVAVSGSGTSDVNVGMPLGGKISAKISRAKNAPGQPRILSLRNPAQDNLIPAPIEPKGNTVKLSPVETTIGGTYTLSIGATDGSSPWLGKVTRVAPRLKPQSIEISNGIDQISYAGSDVATIFKKRCGECHSWANSYGGVKAYAKSAYGKIRSGSMPPSGRLPAEQASLINQWIQTGRAE